MRRARNGWRNTVVVAVAGAALAAGGAARAAIFTAGPGGAYPTIQAAVDAALATAGDHEVRVAQGLYPERVVIGTPAGVLRVSGEWLPGFTSRGTSPFQTIVDAGGAGRPLQVSCVAGRVVVSDLALTGGYVDDETVGGGAALAARGSCEIDLVHDLVTGNTVIQTSPPAGGGAPNGGGIQAFATDDARLALRDNAVFDNHLVNHSTGGAAGAGLEAALFGGAHLELARNRYDGNTAEADVSAALGGGVAISLFENARATIHEESIHDNELSGPAADGSGLFLQAVSCGDCRIEMWRLEVRDDRGAVDGAQARVRLTQGAHLEMTDSLVAGGSGSGLGVAPEGGEVVLTNLTVARHPGVGLRLEPTVGPAPRVTNTLVFGNSPELIGPALGPSNLVGVDPVFFDFSGGDFHLAPGSPAIDAGEDAPPDGLGSHDLDGDPRVLGAHVDVGAYEAWSDTCYVDRFGSLPFVARTAPVCSCFRDDVLRNLGCGFTLPGFFVDVQVPGIVFPGDDFGAAWTIHPWGPVDGPYQVEVSVVLPGGKELPLGGFGGKLRQGKDERQKLKGLVAPELPARLRFRVLQPGGQQPAVSLVELLLPAIQVGEQ